MIFEYLDAPLAAIISIEKKISGLNKETFEAAQSIIQLLRKSKDGSALCPIFPKTWAVLHEEQMELRKTWNMKKICQRINRMPIWMINSDELEFATERINDLGNSINILDFFDQGTSLARKLLSMINSTDSELQRRFEISGVLKLLTRLCTVGRQCVTDSFFNVWNYKESLEITFLVTLDECFRSQSAGTAYLAGECLIKLIDLIPSVKAQIDEENASNLCCKALVPKKANSDYLKTLNVCQSIRDDGTNNDDQLKFLIRGLCGNANGSDLLLKAMEQLFLRETWIGERLLPYVIEYTIRHDPSFANIVAEQFNTVLQRSENIGEGSDRCKSFFSVVRCILGCIKRLQHSGIRKSGLQSYHLLKIDYVLLAKAASVCGMPSVAPMLIDIGTESLRTEELEMQFDVRGSCESLFSDMVSIQPQIGTVLLNSFVAMEDAEAIESLGEFGVTDGRARLLCCENEGDVNKLIALYASIGNAKRDFLPWYSLFSVNFNGGNGSTNGDGDFSCAWKLCQWDTFDRSKIENKLHTFNRLVLDTFKRFDDGENLGESNEISNYVMTNIRERSAIPPFLIRQMIMADDLRTASSLIKNGNAEGIFEPFGQLKATDFDDRLWCCHAIVNRLLNSKNLIQQLQPNWIAKRYTPLCCDQLALCRRKNLHHIGLKIAENSKNVLLSFFENRTNAAESYVAKIELEEIELLWAFGENYKASSLLKSLTTKLESCKSHDPELLCSLTKCLVLLGEFKRHLGSVGNTSSTFTDKFTETARLLENSSRTQASGEISTALGAAHLAMAQFANGQYQEITDYINSPLFAAKRSHVGKFKDEVQNVNQAMRSKSPLVEKSLEERQYLVVSQRKGDVDEREVDEILKRQHAHLVTALTSYLNVLTICDDHDVLIFRVVSLWFDNLKIKEATKVVEKMLPSIKSYKWLAVFPQVASRLATKDIEGDRIGYSKTIRDIVNRVVVDHPYHTFYTIYALSRADPRDETEKSRQNAAKTVLDTALNGRCGDTFKAIEQTINALAALDSWTPSSKVREAEIPNTQRIFALKNMIPIPTMTIEPSPIADYSQVPKIVSFGKRAVIMNGLSAPKRIVCLCSDGIRRRFLLKGGQDDPRQDAIMEQVFRIVNIRLKRKERESGSYEGQYGSMRTYNIVPLSSTLGLIENCEGCISLGDYMTGEGGKPGARAIYYPTEPSVISCRNMITAASKDSLEKRLEVFMKVCQELRPVFRHFFYERFSDPNEWFERRRAYTISVAVSSMVGHIVGLSDRHVQNIMIDKKTGEIVQIDHGMAFEQGRLLPTPEMVPFRLTRDMTNPMGICGLNGLFRRSCVRTLTVLKESKDVLMPILSVLLHDPVSQWTLTVSKAEKKQPEKKISEAAKAAFAESKNIHAERAIIRVNDKLNGREKTELLSVNGQVSHLINLARDPKNLCMMYSGWQAYF